MTLFLEKIRDKKPLIKFHNYTGTEESLIFHEFKSDFKCKDKIGGTIVQRFEARNNETGDSFSLLIIEKLPQVISSMPPKSVFKNILL